MDEKRAYVYLLILSLAGLLFSGFLSYQKLTSNVCTLSSSCAYILGVPSCYYGFAGFLLLSLLSAALYLGIGPERTHIKILRGLSAVFFLFAVAVGIIELPMGPHALLVPTCFYGAVLYAFSFLIATSIERGECVLCQLKGHMVRVMSGFKKP